MKRFFAFVWQTPVEFLKAGFESQDWIAVLLKREDGSTMQRVGPFDFIASHKFLSWLRWANAGHYNIYVSVNALTPGQRSRRREAVHTVRHVFLDVDRDLGNILRDIFDRPDLPTPSCVLHTSQNRAQVLWRVSGFSRESAEGLQKQLARELGCDHAATSAAQMARFPGFYNHKYEPPPRVDVDYIRNPQTYTPANFPAVQDLPRTPQARRSELPATDAVERARRFLARVRPAIEGAHGDLHTFQVCCRLVRGFGLSDADAFRLLTQWNARCQPPWSERELQSKLRHARRYGRESFAGLLETSHESRYVH